MSDSDLNRRLQALQEENGKLYEHLSFLRKMSQTQDDAAASNTAAEVESAKLQLEEAESSRSKSKSRLKELTESHQTLKKELDRETLYVTVTLSKSLSQKRAELRAHLESLLARLQGSSISGSELLEQLVHEMNAKEDLVFALEDDILKMQRTIATKDPYRNQRPDASLPAEDECEEDENPLPCVATSPRSLNAARTKRRVSFQTGPTDLT